MVCAHVQVVSRSHVQTIYSLENSGEEMGIWLTGRLLLWEMGRFQRSGRYLISCLRDERFTLRVRERGGERERREGEIKEESVVTEEI